MLDAACRIQLALLRKTQLEQVGLVLSGAANGIGFVRLTLWHDVVNHLARFMLRFELDGVRADWRWRMLRRDDR